MRDPSQAGRNAQSNVNVKNVEPSAARQGKKHSHACCIFAVMSLAVVAAMSLQWIYMEIPLILKLLYVGTAPFFVWYAVMLLRAGYEECLELPDARRET